MIFLDPRSDIAFKKLFGSSEHKNVLMSFLNSVLELEGEKRIIDVVINDPNNVPETAEIKSTSVDVSCTDQRNFKYIVEMQVVNQNDYAERAQYYTAVALGRQLKKSEKFKLLSPVIFIGILDFDLSDDGDFLSHHDIINRKTGKRLLRHMEWHFVELEKFNKTVDELDNDLEKWLYLLKNARTLDEIPSALEKPDFEEAFDILEYGKLTVKELELYDRYIDAIRSRENQIDTAVEIAVEIAIANEQAKGEANATKRFAKDLLTTTSMNIIEIARLTRLSLEEIKKIKTELAQEKK